jgi:MFS family permease
VTPITALRRRLYLLGFIDEFGPLYAVFTLWFNDNGISTSRVSTTFIVWAAIALALEIPSGALADRVDRRKLLATAFAIRAGGISLWLVWPTFTGVLIGAAMWGIHDALASGTWEAMIHDELTAVDRATAYPTVMARIGQFSHLGLASGTLVGAVLLRGDVGLVALGWLTVAAHAGSIALVTTMPDVRWVTASSPSTDGATSRTASRATSWWATLRAGIRDARRVPLVAQLVVLGAILEGVFILDEYVPLLVRSRGGGDAVAPVIVFVVWVGLLLAGELAARRPDLRSTTLGIALGIGTAVMFVAFVTNEVWTLALLAIGYGTLQIVWIASDARMQERTPSDTRATVASVRGFGSATISMLAFVVIGAMADGDDPTPGHFVVLAVTGIATILVVRWLPERGEMKP